MSKQSNQRYRKEVEKDDSKKAGANNTLSSVVPADEQHKNKINHEFGAASNKSDR